MPYATNGRISQSQIEGGMEINDQQYADALAGMMEGKVVSIDGGFSVTSPPEPEPEPVPEPTTDELILSAPHDLFGGPTLKDIFNGN